MPDTPTFAFIGCRASKLDRLRRVQPAWVDLYTRIAAYCAQRGCLITTGATDGCDQLAAETALGVGGRVALYLPFAGWEETWVERVRQQHPGRVSIVVYDPDVHVHWASPIEYYHDAPKSVGVKDLPFLARNAGIVWEAQGVVALPYREGPPRVDGTYRAGGTGYTLQLARGISAGGFECVRPKSVWDLQDAHARDWWERKLAG